MTQNLPQPSEANLSAGSTAALSRPAWTPDHPAATPCVRLILASFGWHGLAVGEAVAVAGCPQALNHPLATRDMSPAPS